MKLSSTLMVAFGTLLLILGLGILYFFSFGSDAIETTTANEDFFSATLPFFGTKDDRETTSTASPGVPVQSSNTLTLEVRTVTGDILFVEDFTKGSDVIAESDNRVFYILYPNVTSTNASEFDYEINYFPSDLSFSLVIAGEPLAEVRRKATDDLAQRIGLSPNELCSVVATVQTPRWVNQYYADKNLGLPGCPDAVKFSGDPVF